MNQAGCNGTFKGVNPFSHLKLTCTEGKLIMLWIMDG